MEEFEIAMHQLSLRVQECETSDGDGCDAEVSYEEYLRNGGEHYECTDLMDMVELVPLEVLDFDTVPAVLERNLMEGFSG